MVHNVLESIQLLSDACLAFDEHCAQGIAPNIPKIESNLDRNLMLVTALNHTLVTIRRLKLLKRHQEGLSLRDAALRSGHVKAEQYDDWINPLSMTQAG